MRRDFISALINQKKWNFYFKKLIFYFFNFQQTSTTKKSKKFRFGFILAEPIDPNNMNKTAIAQDLFLVTNNNSLIEVNWGNQFFWNIKMIAMIYFYIIYLLLFFLEMQLTNNTIVCALHSIFLCCCFSLST